ncbi:hypothetical protein B4102_0223 [Heyndrickxia sporothermodurans]|uniref:IraD/Gp25-like domain-containing protein n=1 Tax=Heyndrickxia sporothermodurans TaxID=46224 RepID=A0A150KUC1_9BACI|nr:GPW/gp25 family protein [Heyndrickxia sporothermodurans]KYD02629.1 hypothetical protein B4102_0223 [Heyndrickxia sporothermodurans]
MQYHVTSLQKVDFGATGINEILQNISFILSTMKFSCPLDREFGWEPDLDSPINIAQARNTNRIIEAIQENEPRVVVDEVQITGNALDGEIKAIIRVVPDESI